MDRCWRGIAHLALRAFVNMCEMFCSALAAITRSSNQTMKLTATAVRFGETFLVINSLPLRFTLSVSGGGLSFSR